MTPRLSMLPAALAFLLAGATALAADAPAAAKPAAKETAGEASPNLKVGDTVYVCACGAQCTCSPHVSAEPGRCGCKQEMLKAKVLKVGKGQVTVKADGKPEEVVKTPYTCGCAGCSCNSASLKPGKCGCGKPLVKNG